MELLLWLWVLDKRWLLGFKPKLSLYIFAWLIPIVINISMFSFYVYVLNNGVLSHCKYPPYSFHLLDLTPQIVLTTKSVLSFISTLLGLILIKDLVVNRKSEMNKISTNIKNSKTGIQVPVIIAQHDYWIRRKSLGNCNGNLLLLVSCIQIIWSFCFIFGTNRQICDANISKILVYNDLYEIAFFLPIVFVLGLSIIIKVFCFICAYTCPSLIICFSHLFSCKRKGHTLDFKKDPFDKVGILIQPDNIN